jgi:predicted DCC family thiol-disulfide oxidoreductase YuxK/uncharacterized membrane protein YphA (DoxX/SURF4 family)
MPKALVNLVQRGLEKQVPATGLGLFRLAFGLVAFQEICFLYYFRQLIFDPTPYLDIASPSVHLFLVLWAVAALCLALGLYTRLAAIANYLFWLVFTVFTPMWKDFDGGFDQLMLGSSLLLIFLPSERAWSLDRLRLAWRHSTVDRRYALPRTAPVLCYFLPLAVSLGFIYFDSAIHKLFAEFWRNGLGPWLPSSLPYYMSPLDMSWLLEIEPLQRAIGYAIIAFQFAFLFLLYFRRFRVPLMLAGVSLHAGIIVSLNIYPFGFGMLVHYFLMAPFRWWCALGKKLRPAEPALQVYYDERCPLCLKTVLAVEHFDAFRAVAFRGLQTHAAAAPALKDIPEQDLLGDLYAVDRKGRRYSGVATYARILIAMRYPALLGMALLLPGVNTIANRVYRRIADNRARLGCEASCAPVTVSPAPDLAQRIAQWVGGGLRQRANRVSRMLVIVLILQLNCTLHYAILYRLEADTQANAAGQALTMLSNALISASHTFLGITPHPLYLHDHFQGYEHILGITYLDVEGKERWLPFVDEEGRIVSPNWGRVHSMWANVAVTRHMDQRRLDKFVRKVTAFWGARLGLDLNRTTFVLKLKTVEAPMDWEPGLRRHNLSQPWENVGRAVWRDGQMRLELDRDLDALSADRTFSRPSPPPAAAAIPPPGREWPRRP